MDLYPSCSVRFLASFLCSVFLLQDFFCLAAVFSGILLCAFWLGADLGISRNSGRCILAGISSEIVVCAAHWYQVFFNFFGCMLVGLDAGLSRIFREA